MRKESGSSFVKTNYEVHEQWSLLIRGASRNVCVGDVKHACIGLYGFETRLLSFPLFWQNTVHDYRGRGRDGGRGGGYREDGDQDKQDDVQDSYLSPPSN